MDIAKFDVINIFTAVKATNYDDTWQKGFFSSDLLLNQVEAIYVPFDHDLFA